MDPMGGERRANIASGSWKLDKLDEAIPRLCACGRLAYSVLVSLLLTAGSEPAQWRGLWRGPSATAGSAQLLQCFPAPGERA